jgi:hypothetical protein
VTPNHHAREPSSKITLQMVYRTMDAFPAYQRSSGRCVVLLCEVFLHKLEMASADRLAIVRRLRISHEC